MKRLAIAFLAILTALSLAACGDGGAPPSTGSQETAPAPIPTTAAAPYSAEECGGMEWTEVEGAFAAAGFTNIRGEKVEDLESSEGDRVGTVLAVSVGGGEEFAQGEEFDKGTEVLIRYHGFRKYAVAVHVDFPPNLIFSKYDVAVSMNGLPQGTLAHGEDGDFEFTIEPGEYTFTFEEDGDPDVNGSVVLEVKGDTDATLKISCHSDEVEVEVLSVRDLEAEREAAAAEAALEEAFPKEMAKRAVVVAMTNCQATDVFTDDGSAYDPAKFHPYSDIGDFYMTVDTDGVWTMAGESAWRVEGIILRIYGYDTYLKASCEVRMEGENYVVSDVDRTIAAKEDLDSGDPYKTNTEHFEPSESNPFLTVPASLVEEDRDTAVAAEKITAKEEREAWIENQFSWWDGRHIALSELIQENLNDSDSFEHVDVTCYDIDEEVDRALVNSMLAESGMSERVEVGDLFIIEEFTAKNAFNATVRGTGVGIVRGSDDSVILLGIA